jgi:hypothetical protein
MIYIEKDTFRGLDKLEDVISEDQPKEPILISSQNTPLSAQWTRIPIESCLYKQNNISKLNMSYFLNNYEIETIITCN